MSEFTSALKNYPKSLPALAMETGLHVLYSSGYSLMLPGGRIVKHAETEKPVRKFMEDIVENIKLARGKNK